MRRLLALAAVFVLAACSDAPPDTPPGYSPPPPVAETGLITATVEAGFPFGAADLRVLLDEVSLIDFFEETGSIARPVGGVILQGSWPEPGAVRRLELSDGHYVIERVLSDEPAVFRYQIWVFTNSAGRGVEQIVGEQRFVDLPGGGSRFEWDYHVKPRNFVTRFFVRRFVRNEVQPFLQSAVDGAADAAQTWEPGA